MNQKTTLVSRPTKPIHYAIGMFGTSIPINMFKTYAFIFMLTSCRQSQPKNSLSSWQFTPWLMQLTIPSMDFCQTAPVHPGDGGGPGW